MDLSIAIVSWNTQDLLGTCLESVDRTTNSEEREVIVVDNGSTDGSVELVASDYRWAKLICNAQNLGFAHASNQAIKQSQGRYLLLLNSDAILEPGAVQRMMTFMDTHPRAGVVGGMLLNPDGSFQSSYADFPGFFTEVLQLTGLSRWLLRPTYPSYPEAQSQQTREVDWVGGALLMARREAFGAIGLLDEQLFMYSEEVDWCWRMKHNGWAVWYLPEARAAHQSGASSRRIPERKRGQIYRSKWLWMRKHRGSAQAATFRVLVRAISTLKLLLWIAYAISRDPARRESSRRQVASYRYLLANL